MTENTSRTSDFAELRELSLDEIEMTSGAGISSWLQQIFGGVDPQPARGPFNTPTDHLQ